VTNARYRILVLVFVVWSAIGIRSYAQESGEELLKKLLERYPGADALPSNRPEPTTIDLSSTPVLPERPAGTDGLSEDELAQLISRDAMIGVARVAGPASAQAA